MFLKAGALSLLLLLASRLFGLARESAQAAAFGASGLGDVAVLMLALPDWFAGLVASGAMAYVLVPWWASLTPAQVARSQRVLSGWVLGLGVAAALLFWLGRATAIRWLAGGLSPALVPAASEALGWSAIALPAALLAALWTTRLQHERDFTGMYSANLVVNLCLIGGISLASRAPGDRPLAWVGAGLAVAMLSRLGWLAWRARGAAPPDVAAPVAMPRLSAWFAAGLAAGLPLALPFVARSIASRSGEGSLAMFNYAWKLVELPLILAIQLVGTLAFPYIARAVARKDEAATGEAVRKSLALAWALACAAAAGLLLAAPAVARLLFGWGRMNPSSVETVARWGEFAAWGLLPQALIAVTVTLLAAQGRLAVLVAVYGVALAALFGAGAAGVTGGAALMVFIDVLLACVAAGLLAALGPGGRRWVPWRAMGVSLAALLAVAAAGAAGLDAIATTLVPGLVAGGVAAAVVMGATWWASAELRAALAR